MGVPLTLDRKRQHDEGRPDQHQRDGAVHQIRTAEQRNPGDEVKSGFLLATIDEVTEADRPEEHGKEEKSHVHTAKAYLAGSIVRFDSGVICSAFIVPSQAGNLVSGERRKIVVN